MPIRIYSLAKTLGIENKDLVDICTKAGIKGKGSALASLSDDEVTKIKSFIAGDSSSSRAAPGKSTPGTREEAPDVAPIKRDSIIPVRERSAIRDLDAARKRKLADGKRADAPAGDPSETSAVEVADDAPDVPEQAPAEEVGSEAGAVAGSAAASSPSDADVADPVRGQPDLMERRPERSVLSKNPLGMANRDLGRKKPREIGSKKTSGSKKEGAKKEGPLNIRMAAMPEVKQPPPKPGKAEQKVQKPDIALPQDTIRKVRQRGAAPLQQFTENTKTKTKKAKVKGAADVVEVTDSERGAGRGGARAKPKAAEAGTGMGNSRDARTRNRKRSMGNRSDDGGGGYRRRQPRRRSGVNTAAPRKEAVALELPCTVRTFSEAAGIPAGRVLKALMELGNMVTINAQIDEETAYLLAEQLGAQVELKTAETLEDELIGGIQNQEDDPEDLVARPPVVTFLGHVDHGKTSLLDALIGLKVAAGEAGGITQHIRAYTVDKDGRTISFVDTPGHEAFTEMRARGANVTDIAVLVVAADDGVMPQTEEAISHARAAGVPIVVALNKIDLPGVDPNKALQDLASRDLLPSEWGGEIEVVRTSAQTGEGLDLLLETLLVTAELHEYRANPNRPAVGVCLEAEQEPGRGVIAKMIVKNGTLHVGDVVLCGGAYGRVKAMYDTLRPNQRVEHAPPSYPVNITGLDTAPAAGDQFFVVDDIADAREIAERRLHASRSQVLSPITKRVSLEDFQARLESGNLDSDHDVVTLNLIIRADTQGSIEAIKNELTKLDHPEVQIRILQASVGGVTVADVTLASASEAVILAFNVVPDDSARSIADERMVEIRRYDVIYKLTEEIKATLEGKLRPDKQTVELGTVMVLRTFNISRTGTVAGCRVMRGTIERNCRVRVIRDSRVIGEYSIDTLKREKDDVKEVRQGMECGIKLAGFNDIKEADSFEAFRIEEVARTL